MKLKLERFHFAEDYTIGRLSIDGAYYCDTLEDKVRDLTKEKKVMHETAIPEGVYSVIVNVSPRFKRELPRLLEVPHFEGILIHRGNTAKGTSGCILVGENKAVGKVINSTPYELDLTKRIKDAGGATIEIVNKTL